MASSSEPAFQRPPHELGLLLTLAAINFTHIVDFMIMMPLGPQLMRIFDIGPQGHAALVSSYTFAAGTAGFLAAFVIDRFDRKTALRTAYILFIAGTFACAWAPTYTILLVTRALTGTFGGVLSALVLSIIGDAIPLARRGAAMGVVMGAFSVASVLGVPISLYFANLYSWHAPFYIVGSLGMLVLYLIMRFVPPLRAHLEAGKPPFDPLAVLKRVAADINQVRGLSLTLVIMLGQFAVIPFISPYMVSNVGFSEGDLPWIYLLGGGATIFTSPLVGRIADKFGKFRIFSVFTALYVIPVLWVTNMAQTPLPMALFVTTIFFIITNGRFIPSITMITAVVAPAQRGAFMSINSSVQQLAAGLAAYIGGLIVSTGFNGEMIHYERVGYWSVAFAFLAWFIGRKIVLRD